jgi:sucrose phosphorylase
VQRTVVKKLIELIQFRNTHPAFNGVFQVIESDNTSLNLSWHNHGDFATITIDLTKMTGEIFYNDLKTNKSSFFPL